MFNKKTFPILATVILATISLIIKVLFKWYRVFREFKSEGLPPIEEFCAKLNRHKKQRFRITLDSSKLAVEYPALPDLVD